MDISPLDTAGSETWAASLNDAIHVQRERMREYLAAQQTRLEQAERFIEQELRRLEEELQEQRERSEHFQASSDTLAARLAQAESQLAEAQQRLAAAEDREPGLANEELRRRQEAATEELRQAKSQIVDLQERLAKTRSTASRLTRQARQEPRLDWEAEKKRILAALEADADADAEVDDEASQTERMTIVEVLHTTDEVIAAKDLEIQDLKRQLDEKQRELAGKTSDKELIEQAVNSDAVIRQEREQLKRLQAEWREKLRQAEVDLALERAKIARQRAELEESRPAEKSPAASSANTESSRHGRWLARLGLTDADREPRRHP